MKPEPRERLEALADGWRRTAGNLLWLVVALLLVAGRAPAARSAR